MRENFLSLLFIMITFSVLSQTIFGTWYSRNEETNIIDSVIEVYEKKGKAFAKVIEILDKTIKEPICQNCKDIYKDKPILGLTILKDLEKNGNEWSGGNILDPRNGKIYKCNISLSTPNKLKLRGYIGITFFGKTSYWERTKKI
ncbi:DUF2147 domain-containing protein [Polaribacter sp.]|uniref:DUF2147 domain-containing protein n=1 Tax=Polaribacter sp. TaxID=1920175 RepID=UPI003EF66B8C